LSAHCCEVADLVTENELRLLRALVKHEVRFLLVGLSAAALQGAPVVTQDVDLWFEDLSDAKLSGALKEVGAAYVPPILLNPPMLAGSGTEMFDIVLRMDGLGNFAEEWKNSKRIYLGDLEVRILPLQRILASKRAANRAKDKLVLSILEDVLKSNEASDKKE
jgi:hypothetical protein